MGFQKDMERARAHLLLDHPFFGALALKMKIQETTGQTCTDGLSMHVNSEVFEEQTHRQRLADLAEAVLHNAHGHPSRGVGRESKRWGDACDMAIYETLRQSGFEVRDDFPQPINGGGKSAEEYYRLIQEQQSDGGDGDGGGDDGSGDDSSGSGGYGPGNGDPGPGDNSDGDSGDSSGDGGEGDSKPGPGVDIAPPKHQDGSGLSKAERDELEQEWKVATSQAAKAAKAMDKLPDNLVEFIEDLVSPKVDWRALLRELLEATARNDYDWMVPDRSFLQQGIVLPTLHSEECPEIAVVFDTSGSVSKREYEQFLGELNGILEDLQATVRCFWVDTRVAHRQVFEPDDQPILYARYGGGGTCFRPAFEEIQAEEHDSKCLVYLTDGECNTFAEAPDFPVLWITTKPAEDFGWGGCGAPYGEVVELVMD